MSINKSNHNPVKRVPSWQAYQQHLRRSGRNRSKRRKWIPALTAGVLVALVFYFGWTSRSAATLPPPEAVVAPAPYPAPGLSKTDVQLLLSHARIDDFTSRDIVLAFRQQPLTLQTSLNMDLQDYLLENMDRKHSRYVAVVAMDPDSGRVLALAGFNKKDPKANPCLYNRFPAASVFKIVTAAAAVEQCGLTPGTLLHFNGDKYTLYKRQLRDEQNRYTNALTFKDSFAQSVNPVFGKLGFKQLQKPLLEQYGRRFGFNQSIAFELPVAPSHLHITDTPYNWAEIACGFNNETTLSPVHAAMMVSAVANQGVMIEPTVIDRIEDDGGTILYRSQKQDIGRVMRITTADALTRLMETTVKSGTARKAFKSTGGDRIPADVTVAGKTGSIFNQDHDVRFDWFVGFARREKEPGQLAVAVVVGHEEYIGIRAAEYARKAISHYFSHHMARTGAETHAKNNQN